LLKGLRQLAKEHGIRLSTKEEITCPGCNTPISIDTEENFNKIPYIKNFCVLCPNCRIYCSYQLDVATPRYFLREIFIDKLNAYFERKNYVHE